MAEKNRSAPGFMIYREAAIMFSLMPESDAAKAIKATCNYYLYRATPENLTGAAAQVFEIMRADIDRNNEKYNAISQRNQENIRKRWENDNTSRIPVVYQPNTNYKPETINNKHKTINMKDSEAATPPTRARRFTPPTLAEVQAYVSERHSAVDPQGFIDFYSSKGWMVGKTPMKDWKAACRNAESWERWSRPAKDNRIRTEAEYRKGVDFFGT